MGASRPQAIPLGRRQRSIPRFAVVSLLVGLVLGLLVLAVQPMVRSFFAGSPATGGTYREAVVADAIPLDPLADERAAGEPDLTALLFRGLVEVDEHGEVRPDLAERWSVTGEGRIYTLYLRPGLRWDDGSPLTATDVVYTVQQAAAVTGRDGQPSFWSAVSVRAPEPTVVEFTLGEPLGAFLEHAALPVVAAHAPPAGPLPLAPGQDRPAVSGPYRPLEDGTAGVVLERNPAYWGPAARLERIEFHLLPGREAALEALLGGRVDGLAGLSTAERGVLSQSERLRLYDMAELNKYGLLVLNAQSPIFRERAVRRAVGQAIDREALVQVVLEGAGEPALGPLSPLSWAFDVALRYPGYDPDAARALLEEAGWHASESSRPRARGAELLSATLLTSDAPPRQLEAAEIARQLRAVGFEVVTRAVPVDQLLHAHLERADFEAALVGRWLAETDPDQFALWHSTQARGLGGNFAGLSSPEIDRWLEIGRRETTPEARTEAYRRFQAAWAEEQPSVVLYYPHAGFAVSRDLRGVRAAPLPDASWRLRRLPEWYWETARGPIGWIGRPAH